MWRGQRRACHMSLKGLSNYRLYRYTVQIVDVENKYRNDEMLKKNFDVKLGFRQKTMPKGTTILILMLCLSTSALTSNSWVHLD